MISKAERIVLEERYKLAFPDEIEIPPTSIPVAFDLDNPTPEMKPTVTDTASLTPLETRAKEGWLYSSSYVCSDSIKGLGIGFDSGSGEGSPSIDVKTILPLSPAHMIGMHAGDRITKYKSGATHGLTSVSEDYRDFVNALSEVAAHKWVNDRKMLIEGVDSEGREFSRSVTLCPKK